MKRLATLTAIALGATALPSHRAAAVICTVDPFICCPVPCPVFDPTRFALQKTTDDSIAEAGDTTDKINATFGEVRNAIGAGATPIALARSVGVSMSNAGIKGLSQSFVPNLASSILSSSPDLTGGALTGAQISTIAATTIASAQSLLQTSLLSRMSSTIIPTLGQLAPSTLGLQISSAASSFLTQQIGPELAKIVQSAAQNAVVANGSGGIFALGGQNPRQAIATAIVQSIASRITTILRNGFTDRLTAAVLSKLPNASNVLPPIGASSPTQDAIRVAVVQRAVQSPALPTGARSALETQFDHEARGGTLNALAVAWNLRSGLQRSMTHIPDLSSATRSADTDRAVMQQRTNIVVEVIQALSRLNAGLAAWASIHGAQALQNSRELPEFVPSPPLSPTPATGNATLFGLNGSPVASSSTLSALLDATGFHNALTDIASMANAAQQLQAAITTHSTTVANAIATTNSAANTLGPLYQNPATAYSNISLGLLSLDRTEWWDTSNKFTSASTAAQTLASAIVSNPSQFGAVLPSLTLTPAGQTTTSAQQMAAQLAPALLPIMTQWLDQSKEERFWRPLAEQSSVQQADLSAEAQVLAARLGVTDLNSSSGPAALALLAAATTAAKNDPRGLDPSVASTINALAADGSFQRFITRSP